MVFKERKYFGSPPEVEILHPTKADLEADVAAALADSGSVDAAEVEVTAHDGAVTLTGHVSDAGEIGRCTEIALSVEGVRRVDNRISLMP